MRARRGNEEGEGRAIMERTIFTLNICMLRRIKGTMMEEPERSLSQNRKWDLDQVT
jgi:hypothetical protein